MSDEYTPTTEEVRLEYMAVRWGKNDTVSFEARAEFDRWLAEVERAAAEKALREMRDFDEGVSSLLLESWSRMVATTALAAAGVAPQSATLAVESLQCDSQCDFQCDSVIDETALADEFARHGHVMVAPGPHECSCGATLEWVEGGYSRAFKLHQARAVAAWLKDGGAR